MDPVTALGLASNICTFVDVGFKAVRQYKDFRRNRLDETRDNAERRIIAEQLRNVSSNLISDGPPSLVALGGECRRLCDELLAVLDKLSVKNPDSTRERLQVVFKSYVQSPDISSLENRLDLYRRQLVIGFLQTLRDEQANFSAKLDNIELELSQLKDSRSKQIAELRSDLLQALQLHEHTASQVTFDKLGRILSQLRDMMVTCGPEAAILMQLKFSEIYSREDAIKPPTEGTALWPIPEPTDTYEHSSELSMAYGGWSDVWDAYGGWTEMSNRRANSFTPWLRSGSGVFHISGKAGSGKSTLMKHIWLHDRTQEHLESWAGNQKLLKAAFFFWASGNDEQRSLNGLFRSILFTILSRDKGLIPYVFPQCWENGQFVTQSVAGVTRPDVIEAAFITLLGKATNSGYRICLFIDGLDEFEATDRESYWELAIRLGEWADHSGGNVKLCVSSRPYQEFQDIFRASRSPNRIQIHLHQLNKVDIERYCQKTLSDKARECPNISKIIEEHGRDLVEEIVSRAEGVFLWVVLVVRIVVSEARRGGSCQDLARKLEETPDEMDKLYSKMLGSLGRSEKELATRLLFAVLTNPFSQDMSALCLKWLVDTDAWRSRRPQRNQSYYYEDAVADIEYVTRHLDIWTQGLIEVVHGTGYWLPPDMFDSPLFVSKVRLIHKTAKDYLLHSMELSEVRSAFKDFDLAGLHAELRLTELFVLRHFQRPSFDIFMFSYGYELLVAKSDASLGRIGEDIGEYQLTWPMVKDMALMLPSECSIETFQPLSPIILRDPSFRVGCIRRAPHNTSQAHLATSLRLNEAEITKSLSGAESDSSSSSLLLSACLSGLMVGECPIGGKVSSLDLVKGLMQRGYSAHQRVKLLSWEDNADKFASVWMILVSYIANMGDAEYKANTISKIMDILGELSSFESQEEVVLLGTTAQTQEEVFYDCFVTLEDLVQSSGLESKLINELRSQSTNRKGDLKCEHELCSVWERWDGRTIYPMSKHLEKLTPESLKGPNEVSLRAVVSRTYLLEKKHRDTHRIRLW